MAKKTEKMFSASEYDSVAEVHKKQQRDEGMQWVQTWTLECEQTTRVESMVEKKVSTSNRLMDVGSARKRDADKAALEIASSGEEAIMPEFRGCKMANEPWTSMRRGSCGRQDLTSGAHTGIDVSSTTTRLSFGDSILMEYVHSLQSCLTSDAYEIIVFLCYLLFVA